MLCAIYKSLRKEGMYLYVAKRDQFDRVPEDLRQMFGKPQFVMMFNLAGEKQIKGADNREILQTIENQGFYLQMPPPPENLLTAFLQAQKQANQ